MQGVEDGAAEQPRHDDLEAVVAWAAEHSHPGMTCEEYEEASRLTTFVGVEAAAERIAELRGRGSGDDGL